MFHLPPDLDTNKIARYKTKIISRVTKINEISLERFYFTKTSEISISNTIHVYYNNERYDKTCTSYRDFDNNTYLQFSGYNLPDSKYIFPKYICKSFKCLSCNKIHSKNSTKCCSMANSIIEVINCEIKEIIATSEIDTHSYLKNSRDQFISLHFPDLLDTILLR